MTFFIDIFGWLFFSDFTLFYTFVLFFLLFFNFDSFIYSKFYKILKIYFTYIMISHTFTCLFIFLGTISYPNWIFAAKLQDANFVTLYFSSFYYFNLNIFTIGIAEILPKNIYERIYSIILMIMGVMIYSFILTNLIMKDDCIMNDFIGKSIF